MVLGRRVGVREDCRDLKISKEKKLEAGAERL